MKRSTIIVIGGIAAGPSAAAKAARTNPHAEVILFEQSETVSYGVCEIPYLIGGEIEDETKLVLFSPEKLAAEKNISVKVLHRVEKIIPNKRNIIVRDLNANTLKEYHYDRLIIATGAVPKKLNIDGENARNVFYVRSRAETLALMNFLKTENPKRAVIIGGGFIGLEMAEAFRKRNLEVTIIHNDNLPLDNFEIETSEEVLKELKKQGIEFIPNAKTEAFIKSKSEKIEFVITNRGSFEADIVVIATGIAPNTGLAKGAGIRLGVNGAIKVNNFQETSIDRIYAAGDCCEVKNIVTGKPAYIPLATVASRSAWVAGENAAGERAKFAGGIYSAALKLFSLEIAKVGISSKEAAAARYRVVTDFITTNSRIPFMPGNKKLSVKLIVDQTSRKILGANVFGEDGGALRANTLAVAIQQKLTVDELSKLDLIYAPTFSPLWDPILIAANSMKKKL